MAYGKYFLPIGVASCAAIALGLYLGNQCGDLTGEPERTLFFGGVIVGCINVVLAAILPKDKSD
jgi:putative Mn2+ efflux pump MntP